MAITTSIYKGKEELTMAQYEALTSIDSNTDYNIIDYPNGYITSSQMTFALTCSRLFQEGETFVCIDDGTYKKGNTYKISIENNVKSWEDITPNYTSFVEDTTGSADPSPLDDYYNKSQVGGLLNQKADTNLTNINPTRTSSSLTINGIAGTKYSGAHICIESWVSNDGTSGYRIYDDGYCEQWGEIVSGGTVSLLKTLRNTDYQVFLSIKSKTGDAGIGANIIVIADKTISSFRAGTSNNYQGINFYWISRGYIAQ